MADQPPEWPDELRPKIRAEVLRQGRKIVVLDDDPTGTQTVHDVAVLTEWSRSTLQVHLKDPTPIVYILTNSRSMPQRRAAACNQQIARRLHEVQRQVGRPVVLVSRSDSTLRGHFPAELEALEAGWGGGYDAWLLCPFFAEGGRITVRNVHYVIQGERCFPAGQTAFARDAVFGYRASDLCHWVDEKTRGRIAAQHVASISLEELRQGGPTQVATRLQEMFSSRPCVVNAVSYRDLEVLVAGLLMAESNGKRFLYRTAASFVQVRAGMQGKSILARKALARPADAGGLIVVGSHVPKTTDQLEHLLAHGDVDPVEASVPALLNNSRVQNEIERIAALAEASLKKRRNVTIYTSRKLVVDQEVERNLSISHTVSQALSETVRRMDVTPRYIIAKGGITASDIATEGLGVKQAEVRGQILPGIPLWELGAESRYPGLLYIVFPGNVGDTQALTEVVQRLQSDPQM